jgi:hypothetical protein
LEEGVAMGGTTYHFFLLCSTHYLHCSHAPALSSSLSLRPAL